MVANALGFTGLTLQWLSGGIAFLWGLVVLHALFGIVGVLVGIFIAPATLVLAPLYAAFADGYWFPLLGPLIASIVGAVMIGVAERMQEGQ